MHLPVDLLLIRFLIYMLINIDQIPFPKYEYEFKALSSVKLQLKNSAKFYKFNFIYDDLFV